MSKVWRVENSDGIGCYTQDDFYVDEIEMMINRHCTRNGHPSPFNDKGIDRSPRPKEYCAFISRKQAHQWFTDFELKMLSENGFYLKELDANITAIGEKQILISRP